MQFFIGMAVGFIIGFMATAVYAGKRLAEQKKEIEQECVRERMKKVREVKQK